MYIDGVTGKPASYSASFSFDLALLSSCLAII